MITRTDTGYQLGSYLGIPTKLKSGRKITGTETRAALCRINGFTQAKAAVLMHCSKSNDNQMWQSIFFKTNTSDALTAVVKLLELGILKHLMICFIILSTTLGGFNPSSTDPIRPPRPSVRIRIRRQDDIAGVAA